MSGVEILLQQKIMPHWHSFMKELLFHSQVTGCLFVLLASLGQHKPNFCFRASVFYMGQDEGQGIWEGSEIAKNYASTFIFRKLLFSRNRTIDRINQLTNGKSLNHPSPWQQLNRFLQDASQRSLGRHHAWPHPILLLINGPPDQHPWTWDLWELQNLRLLRPHSRSIELEETLKKIFIFI